MNNITYSCTTFAIAFTMLLPLVITKRLNFLKKNIKINTIRSVLSVTSLLSLYYSISRMPVIEVVSLTLLYPLVTITLAVLFLKEKVGIRRISGLVIGFMGGIIIINPAIFFDSNIIKDSTPDNDIIALSAVFITTVFWSILDIITRVLARSNDQDNPPVTQLSSIFFFNSILSVCPVLWMNIPLHMPNELYIYAAMSAAVLLLSYWTLIKSYAVTELSITSPLYFSSLIFTAIISFFAFGETIKNNVLIGSVIVILSSSYISYREYVISKQTK